MAQIVGYLTEKEALRFLDYAQACGVTGSTLANLLISRELRLGRLSVLAEAFEAQRSLPNSAKIVAHLTDPDRKTEFYAHAARHGLKPAAAAAALYRAEIAEFWLLRALRVNQFDSD
ncbi:hypothetical protein ABC365_00090 [Brevundimonas sp. 3P9-tot-E]|jgi:hypothetical protein|uniref:hypothetical protein n=1 Tax=Brevundimonas TaxID=41275 RepID=UPI0008AE5605|nr:MAG: hypothetical protein A2352_09140 [Caulobacterales bacterium RIFOXYB1_FULL_67_16]